MPHTHSLLSRLPGLDALLRLPATRHLITRHGRHAVSEAARAELEQLRAHVRQHAGWPQWFAGIDSLPPRLENSWSTSRTTCGMLPSPAKRRWSRSQSTSVESRSFVIQSPS